MRTKIVGIVQICLGLKFSLVFEGDDERRIAGGAAAATWLVGLPAQRAALRGVA